MTYVQNDVVFHRPTNRQWVCIVASTTAEPGLSSDWMPWATEGAQGPEGPRGAAGATGQEGPQGPQGLQGLPGLEGPAGPQGEQGPEGDRGLPGPRGDQGDAGPQGPKGDQGEQGIPGVAGQDAVGNINYLGVWSPTATYNEKDVVVAPDGNSYACLVDGTIGGDPTADPEWVLFTMKGPKGDKGDQGERGNDGANGAQGPQGEAGPEGAPGPRGPQGNVGPQGDPGIAGPEGPQGLRGPQGERGLQGERGDTGAQGAKGDAGPPQNLNITGLFSTTRTYMTNDVMTFNGNSYIARNDNLLNNPPTNPDGDSNWSLFTMSGPAGPKGDKGDKGDQGATGNTGPQGDQGPRGDAGPRGEKGDQGDVGPRGDQGQQGPTGPQGAQGDVGPRGLTGDQGIQGPVGPVGPKGDDGPPGPRGDEGAQGPVGPAGDPGPEGIAGPPGEAGPPANLNFRGIWSATSTYMLHDVITYPLFNNSYIARQNNLFNNPPSSEFGDNHWALYVARGPQGEQGPRGLTGPPGEQGLQGPRGEKGDRGEPGSGGGGFTLGSQLDVMNILDNKNHSTYLKDIYEIPDFNTNAKRWELFQSPTAWKYVVDDHRAFWNWIREIPANYKLLLSMLSPVATAPIELITVMTDNENEFKQVNAFNRPTTVPFAQPLDVGTGDTITTSVGRPRWRHGSICLNPNSRLIRRSQYGTYSSTATALTTTIRGDIQLLRWDRNIMNFVAVPFDSSNANGYVRLGTTLLGIYGKCPELDVTARYVAFLDRGDEVLNWPSQDNPTSASQPWMKRTEKDNIIIVGQHHMSGVNRMIYNVRTKQHLFFESLNQREEAIATPYTNFNESMAAWFTGTARIDVYNPALHRHYRSVPSVTSLPLIPVHCKTMISPDGQFIVWLDEVTTTPAMRIFRLSDGQMVYAAPVNGLTRGAIWTKENVVWTINNVGQRHKFDVTITGDTVAVTEQLNFGVIAAADYEGTYLDEIDMIFYGKRATHATAAPFIIVDAITGAVVHQAANGAGIHRLWKATTRQMVIRVPGKPWYLVGTDLMEYCLKFDLETREWTSAIMPGGTNGRLTGQSNGTWQFNHMTFFDNGNIVVWGMATHTSTLVRTTVIDLRTNTAVPGGELGEGNWTQIIKLDDTHFLMTRHQDNAIYEVTAEPRVIQKIRTSGDRLPFTAGFSDLLPR